MPAVAALKYRFNSQFVDTMPINAGYENGASSKGGGLRYCIGDESIKRIHSSSMVEMMFCVAENY